MRQKNLGKNMVTGEQFDALEYFKHLAESNKLAKDNGFIVDFCSGPEALAPAMANFRDAANFIFIDDTSAGNTHSNKVGWFDKSVYTVFIIAGWDMRKNDYNKKLRLCRTIFRQLLSKVIHDIKQRTYGDELVYLQINNVYTNEFGRYSFNGATGMMFMINNEEPTNLIYDPEQWL